MALDSKAVVEAEANMAVVEGSMAVVEDSNSLIALNLFCLQ